VADLIAEMAQRTATGYLFGGLASSRGQAVQFAVGGNGNIKGQGAASGVFSGGMSGVAFGEGVALVSRVTQGCLPVARCTVSRRPRATSSPGWTAKPALDVLLRDLAISLDATPGGHGGGARHAGGPDRPGRPGRPGDGDGAGDMVSRTGNFGVDTVVRHIIGLDPSRRGIAVAQQVSPGMRMAFCQRNAQAARADLIRICAEIREELEPEEMSLPVAAALAAPEAQAAPNPARRIAGAVYVSCAGRGGPHFGGPSAEMQIVRRALGDVPLVGFLCRR
jgi:small ligand-binding sensory domain FIST